VVAIPEGLPVGGRSNFGAIAYFSARASSEVVYMEHAKFEGGVKLPKVAKGCVCVSTLALFEHLVKLSLTSAALQYHDTTHTNTRGWSFLSFQPCILPSLHPSLISLISPNTPFIHHLGADDAADFPEHALPLGVEHPAAPAQLVEQALLVRACEQASKFPKQNNKYIIENY